MTVELSTFLSVLPPVLLLLAGFLILHASPSETAGRRMMLYYLSTGAGLALVLFLSGIIQRNIQSGWMAALLIPALIGLLTLLLINLNLFRELNRSQKILFFILGAALIGLLVWISFLENGGIGMMVVPGALLLALFWIFGSKSTGIAFSLSLVGLIGMGWINAEISNPVEPRPAAWISTLMAILAAIGPVIMVVLAAIFITRGLKELAIGPENPRPHSIFRGVVWLMLAFAMLGYLLSTIGWAAIWDQTSDGIGGVWLWMETSLVAVGAGMVMALTSSGRRRTAGFAFAVLAPLLINFAAQPKWLVYHSITDARAERIQHSVEAFHARNGRFPATLAELVPRDLLWVQNPVLFRGEGWCYQANDDFYRLGAVYREFFSAPISVHVYASQGTATTKWDCDQRAAHLIELYGPGGGTGLPIYPAETPMPASVAPMEAKTANLVYKAGDVYLGDWSPKGNYLVFGSPQGTGNQQEVELAFLDPKTSQVCPVPGRYKVPYAIRGQYAWLPDERLLFLPTDGDMVLIRPCQGDVERLAGRFPETMTGLIVPAQKNSKALIILKSAASFWILNGTNLEVLKIQGVTPTPYELHWDQASWSPGGDMLSISRLNGREKKDGSTLYIVSAGTGEVIQSLPMQATADQSAPRVEWLSDHDVLLDVEGDLSLADMRINPWKITRVIRDIFNLNVSIPNEISAWGSFVEPSGNGYHLAVRVNLPRNQAVYVYHSETGKVEVYHPQGNAILFFPGGDWAQFMKLETPSTFRNEFEMFWVDEPEKGSQMLKVQGHTPRSYPDLYGNYLAEFQEIAFSSSQGVSLVSITDGKTLGFWRLGDRRNNIQPSLLVSPDGGYLVVDAPGDGLYRIQVDR